MARDRFVWRTTKRDIESLDCYKKSLGWRCKLKNIEGDISEITKLDYIHALGKGDTTDMEEEGRKRFEVEYSDPFNCELIEKGIQLRFYDRIRHGIRITRKVLMCDNLGMM